MPKITQLKSTMAGPGCRWVLPADFWGVCVQTKARRSCSAGLGQQRAVGGHGARESADWPERRWCLVFQHPESGPSGPRLLSPRLPRSQNLWVGGSQSLPGRCGKAEVLFPVPVCWVLIPVGHTCFSICEIAGLVGPDP